MWVVRELARLAGRILVALVVAVLVAEARILISGGAALHTFRVVCILIGGLYLLLAAGPGMTLDGRVGGTMRSFTGYADLQPVEGPRLTATAVFIGSGLVLLALAVFL